MLNPQKLSDPGLTGTRLQARVPVAFVCRSRKRLVCGGRAFAVRSTDGCTAGAAQAILGDATWPFKGRYLIEND